MKTIKFSLLCAIAISMQATALFAQTFTVLHAFGNTNDGQSPSAGLTVFGNTLFGTTFQGDNGSGLNLGTIYSISTDGTAYKILYSFSGSDGQEPRTIPVVSGGFIYGATAGGGSYDDGVIFRLRTSGSNNFNILHTFDGGEGGTDPDGGLLLTNGILYGTTRYEGIHYSGTIYSLGINGDGFTNLYAFTSATDSDRDGQLVLSSNMLYGMSATADAFSYGMVYSICTNGSNHTVLHLFSPPDGVIPVGNLVLSGSTLYGTTEVGGSNNWGTVFAIETDGSNYRQLHAFGALLDGQAPGCTLTLSGNVLYGTTFAGGSGGYGTIFSINTDGTGYQILHNFSPIDGTNLRDPLVFLGTNLYGVARQGGLNGLGTLFQLSLPPTNSAPPAAFFNGETPLDGGWFWMDQAGDTNHIFGEFTYSSASFPFIYHLDMGWEYFFDADNAQRGGYFYDFTDGAFFYTEPGLFPYLYDFKANSWMWYDPLTVPTSDGHFYTSNPRWLFNFTTGMWVNSL